MLTLMAKKKTVNLTMLGEMRDVYDELSSKMHKRNKWVVVSAALLSLIARSGKERDGLFRMIQWMEHDEEEAARIVKLAREGNLPMNAKIGIREEEDEPAEEARGVKAGHRSSKGTKSGLTS